MNKKNIIITGGLGFIGSNFIRSIIDDKSFNILNIDSETYAANLMARKDFNKYENYNHIKDDITSDMLSSYIEKFSPNYIINFAAETHVDRSIEEPLVFLKSNILGTVNILESILKIKDTTNIKFIHISTDEVFGDAEDGEFFSEDSSIRTSSPYSASKASAEHFVNSYIRTYGLDAVILNITNNYGPYQTPEKLIPKSILSAVKNMPIEIYGNGMNERDWLWVDDTAKAIKLILDNDCKSSRYCIGMGNSISNIEILNKIATILDQDYSHLKPQHINSFKDNFIYVDDRPGHDFAYRIDSSKINNELGWFPQESLESGLKKTIEFYIKNLDFINIDDHLKRKGNL